jgi:segregation and condensation protein B
MTDMVDMPTSAASSETVPEITTDTVVEALLFSTDAPLSAVRIAQLLGTGDAGDVKRHIDELNERYEQSGASFRIESIAKGYQMLTLPAYNHWLGKLHKARAESRLSKAALETLAIVAYKQPVLRADIEAVRGVAVGDMLVRLREMNLVRIVGRAEEIGRPLLYGTTKRFLEVFGLGSLKDLPKVDRDDPEAVPLLRLADENNQTSEPQEDETPTTDD